MQVKLLLIKSKSTFFNIIFKTDDFLQKINQYK
jgi:hypothetical protein